MDDYNEDPVHHEVGVYNESVCRPERTARIDWWYDGPPRIEKGLIHSVALYLWRDEASDTQKDDVREAFRSLNKSVPSVKSLITGDGTIGTLVTDYDLIVDAIFNTLDDCQGLHGAPRLQGGAGARRGRDQERVDGAAHAQDGVGLSIDTPASGRARLERRRPAARRTDADRGGAGSQEPAPPPRRDPIASSKGR